MGSARLALVLGRLFLLFTLVPALELWLLISIGGWLGALPTLGLVVATGLAGAALAKREGFRVLRSWQEAGARGELPKDGIISSALVLVGGVLLVTPGVVTDFVGLALLVPAARRFAAAQIKQRLEKRFELQSAGPSMFFAMGGPGSAADGEVIDVDAHEPAEDVDDLEVTNVDADVRVDLDGDALETTAVDHEPPAPRP